MDKSILSGLQIIRPINHLLGPCPIKEGPFWASPDNGQRNPGELPLTNRQARIRQHHADSVHSACALLLPDTMVGKYCGWTKSISPHLEIWRNHCLLVFTGEASFQGCLDGAGFRPSTVGLLFLSRAQITASFVKVTVNALAAPLDPTYEGNLNPQKTQNSGLGLQGIHPIDPKHMHSHPNSLPSTFPSRPKPV